MTEGQRKMTGALLRERREYLGFTTGDIAAFLLSSREYVADCESGQCNIAECDIERLATLYGRPVGYFTGEELPEPTTCVFPTEWDDLEGEDREELKKFAEFLRWRKEARKG